MKILISSHRFAPEVGGVESVGRMLAEEFSELGHQVRVVTQTAAPEEEQALYKIMRRPSPWALMRSVHWCDVFLHNNISLRAAWPLLGVPRPWVIANHTWICRPDGRTGLQDRMKLAIMRHSTCISISPALAASLPIESQVIPDPYDDGVFQLQPQISRQRDLVFVGRLVSDKGADLALTALAMLGKNGLRPTLTVVGEGPERINLQRQAAELGLAGQVTFTGFKTGPALARLLNEQRIMIVPSRWQEPFGIVALEGIACGCAVVGSEGGGLKAAIGPCGFTFPNGDSATLADCLQRLLTHPELLATCRDEAPTHLHPHRRMVVAQTYVRIFEALVSLNPRWLAPFVAVKPRLRKSGV